MAPKVAKTEGELVKMLRARYCQDAGNGVSGCVIAQVRDAAGFDATRSLDAVAMGFWPSRGLLIEGFECKSSRSDWQRELKDPAKAEQFVPMLDKFWIVAGGPGIVDEAELPPDWGLLVARGKSLVQVRAAGALRDLSPVKVEGSRKKVRPLPPAFSRGFLVSLLRNGTARAAATPEEVAQAEQRGFDRGIDYAQSGRQDYEKLYNDLRGKVNAFQMAAGFNPLSEGWGENGKTPDEIGRLVKAAIHGDINLTRLIQRLERVITTADEVANHGRELLQAQRPDEPEASVAA